MCCSPVMKRLQPASALCIAILCCADSSGAACRTSNASPAAAAIATTHDKRAAVRAANYSAMTRVPKGNKGQRRCRTPPHSDKKDAGVILAKISPLRKSLAAEL